MGKTFALVVIGALFVVEVASSLFQLLSKKYLGRKIMAVAPLHLWLQYKGWPEPKIVMRFWILSILFSAFGLWLALLTR
jgi:phospho-N-acetylmuramoyl-pentapeptide-transferase